MEFRNFTNSGVFVVAALALSAVLVPFALEQIGETTGLFKFDFRKNFPSVFSAGGIVRSQSVPKKVDWVACKNDMEAFSAWVDSLDSVRISLPPHQVKVVEVDDSAERPRRKIWPVPVVALTPADGAAGKRGYVFLCGFERPFREGEIIAPSHDKCGYEIVSVSGRTVWLRAVLESKGDSPMGVARFPDFTRVDGKCLVKGLERFEERDAFRLKSGGWLVIDSFLPPDSAVFKILDAKRRVVAMLLCVVIGEKGDGR